MKKIYVLILLLFISVTTFSQVKIGNNPGKISQAALLELESENKGLLISKIELNNTSDWTLNGEPVEGMLIFNETGFADKGFYYWDDILGEWLKVLNKSELQNLDNDDQLIQSFVISETELLLEIENGGGEKKVSFLELLGNEQFVTVFADSLLDNSLFQSGIQQLILANSTQLTETEVDAFVSDNGYLTSEVDGDATNELQTISRSGLTVTLSDGGGTFQDSVLTETAVDAMVSDNGYLTGYTETDPTVSALVKSIDAADTTRWGIDTDTQLSESEVDAFVSDNGYLTSEVDGDATNELQTISRSGLMVTLSDGGGTFQDSVLTETAVDAMVSDNGYLTGYTETDPTVSALVKSIDAADTTRWGIDTDTQLSESEVDAFVSDNGYLTSEVDGDATNELQTISRSGLMVTLSDGGGTFQDSVLTETAVDAMVSDNGYLTGYTETDPTVSALVKSIDAADTTRWGIDTDTQLSETEVDAFVSDNGYLTSEVDGDATNELQTISRSGLMVTLSDGGGTFQDSVLTETAVDAMVSDNGYLTGYTETDPTVSALVKSIDAADTTRWGIDTDTQLSESEVDAFVSDNGYLTSEVDGDATNELQTLTGDITSTGTTTLTTTIGNDKILESHLKAVNTPTDEYVLTYEQTTGDFEWQEMTGGSSTSVYGEIHSVSGVFSASTTFQTITNYTVGSNSGVTVSSSGMTIVTSGVYMITYSASFSASNNGKVISSSLFNNSTELTKVGWERKINSAGDVGSVAASGIVSLSAGNVLTIKMKQDSGPSNTDITFNKINISIYKL